MKRLFCRFGSNTYKIQYKTENDENIEGSVSFVSCMLHTEL